MDRSWKGFGAPKWVPTFKNPTVLGPRGGVGEGLKPLPRGKRGSGKKDSWKEGASKPPVAQRAGGTSPCDKCETLRTLREAKVAPKWIQISIKKLSDFWMALGRALARQRAVRVP